MNINRISDLPDWDDERLNFGDEDGEDWKPNATRIACKALYGQWQQIVFLLNGVLLPIIEKPHNTADEDFINDTAKTMLGDAYIVGAKIFSSEIGDLYTIRMANAAIIRANAQSISSDMLLLDEDKDFSVSYIGVIRSEIDKFRALFIDWVNTFEKDDFVDEWGLFV